ncbi:hypothetical protein GH733_015626 [Mirounga leonina]|nr:hypothetical protein GH733_015626 [Mirounga leonina]
MPEEGEKLAASLGAHLGQEQQEHQHSLKRSTRLEEKGSGLKFRVGGSEKQGKDDVPMLVLRSLQAQIPSPQKPVFIARCCSFQTQVFSECSCPLGT